MISVLRLYVSMVNIEYTNIRTWLVGSYNFSRNSLTHWRFFFLSRDDSFSISIYMGPLTLRFSTLSPTSIDHIENQTSSPPYAFDNCYFREWIWLDISCCLLLLAWKNIDWGTSDQKRRLLFCQIDVNP